MVGRAPPPSLTCGGVVPLATARSTPEQTARLFESAASAAHIDRAATCIMLRLIRSLCCPSPTSRDAT
eukprot:6532289-Prymnesium_polylepis.1